MTEEILYKRNTSNSPRKNKLSMRDQVRKLHLKILSELENEYLFRNNDTESLFHKKWKNAIKFYDNTPNRRHSTIEEDLEYLNKEGIFSIGNYDGLVEILNEVDHRASEFVLKTAKEIREIQMNTDAFNSGPPQVQLSGKYKIEAGNDIELKGFILSCPPPTDVKWKRQVDKTSIDINIDAKNFVGTTTDKYNPVLIINDAVVEDSGMYLLSVDNHIKRVISNILTVEVREPDTNIEASTTISVTPTREEKKNDTNTFLSITCRTINSVVDWIGKKTSVKIVLTLFESINLCTQGIYQRTDRVLIESLLDSVTKKIVWWGSVDVENRTKAMLHIIKQLALITAKFNGSDLKVERGSLLFQMKFETRKDFINYEKEYKNGELEKRFQDFLTHVPYLKLFALDEDDVILRVQNVQQISRKKKSECTCVAAIDFGAFSSGYAYARKKNWNDIEVSVWPMGNESKSKAKNHILLNPDQTFHSFGYEAEDAYAQMADNENEFKEYFYFEEFSTVLPEQGSLDKISVRDRGGKSLPVVLVLNVTLAHIIGHMLDRIKQETPNMKMDEIKCVMVTHLNENEHFTSVVKTIFVEKGIDADAVSITSHCEAVARYCQFSSELELQQIKSGMSYMAVNLGEGISTVSLHIQGGDGKEYKVLKVADIPMGCRHIRNNFLKFLSGLFGKDMLDKIMLNQQEDYKDLLREFEFQRVKLSLSEDDIECTISPMIPAYIQMESGSTIYDVIEATEYKDSVNFSSGNLVIPYKLFCSFLEPVVENIVEGVRPLISKHDPSAIIVCGELSKCPMIQKRIQEVSELKVVLFLSDHDAIEVKGAVLSCVPS